MVSVDKALTSYFSFIQQIQQFSTNKSLPPTKKLCLNQKITNHQSFTPRKMNNSLNSIAYVTLMSDQ